MTLAHADRQPDPAECISHLFGAAGCRSQVVGRQRTWVTSEEHAAKMVRGGPARAALSPARPAGRRTIRHHPSLPLPPLPDFGEVILGEALWGHPLPWSSPGASFSTCPNPRHIDGSLSGCFAICVALTAFWWYDRQSRGASCWSRACPSPLPSVSRKTMNPSSRRQSRVELARDIERLVVSHPDDLW